VSAVTPAVGQDARCDAAQGSGYGARRRAEADAAAHARERPLSTSRRGTEWRDYDRNRGLIRVRRARVWAKDKLRTKTGNARSIELLEAAKATLQRQRAFTELVGRRIFHNPRTKSPWNDEQVQRKVLDATLRRLGIRHRPPKQTRHTFATMCLMSGANPAWVARQMGHANTKMLYEVYSKWIDRADRGLERAKVEAWIVLQMSRSAGSK